MAICKYPGCDEIETRKGLCRRHGDAHARAQAARKAAARDKSDPWDWHTLSIVEIRESGPICRCVISRDPIRRREEMQAGCPLTLHMAAVALAPLPALSFVAYHLGRTFDKEAAGLFRPGWWPVDGAIVADQAVQICMRHSDDLPTGLVHPARLRDRRYDLSDDKQHRLVRLLNLLEEAGH